MSDAQPDSGQQHEANVPSNPDKGTSPIRLVILLLIFGIALTCLLYDYCIARPAHKGAYDAILGLLDGTTPAPSGDGTVTDDEVQSILGCKPSKIEALSNGKIEIYSWRSGLPFRTYDLFIVYTSRKMPLLHFASTERPLEEDLPPRTVLAKPPTQKELDNFEPSNPEGMKSSVGMSGGKPADDSTPGPARVRKQTASPAAEQGDAIEQSSDAESEPKAPTTEEGGDS